MPIENITIMLSKIFSGAAAFIIFMQTRCKTRSMLYRGCSFARKTVRALISAGINFEDEPIQASVTKQQNAQLTTSNGNSKRGPTHSVRSLFKVPGQCAP